MAMRPNPPKIFAILLTLLGLEWAGRGMHLFGLDGLDGPVVRSLYFSAAYFSAAYFSAAGVGVAVSGGLIACGKLAGAYLYAVVLVGIIV